MSDGDLANKKTNPPRAGRATVVKSLLIPKINYLLLSLPQPNIQIMKDINRCFFEFMLNCKPDKTSR